jgi:2-oxoglutarate ferredoxin oxidoreductase subunit beta
MDLLPIDEFLTDLCPFEKKLDLGDYEGEAPRWCQGCGDLGILTAVEKMLRDNQARSTEVVCVSGIGCSSRFPYYLKTFGFHGIHGRALPISTGVALANPQLKVLTVMGDGDCFSIGVGHWLHALRYNINLLAMVFDNQIFGLTRKQTSPTTPLGTSTRTAPKGAFLPPLNPLKLMMGATNISFLAQTATWLPQHLSATLQKAYEHRGLSFVRILQHCPVFSPQAFGEGGKDKDLFAFLVDEKGIAVDPVLERFAEKQEHNPADFEAAQKLAAGLEREPLGLIFHDPNLPSYESIRLGALAHPSPEEKLAMMNRKLAQLAPEGR